MWTDREFGKTTFSNSKVHGANMGPIWSRQDPFWPHFGPVNFAIWIGQSFIIIFGGAVTLQWRRIIVMASQITGNSTVCSWACSRWQWRKHQSSALLALCERNPAGTGGFTAQRASNAESIFKPWFSVMNLRGDTQSIDCSTASLHSPNYSRQAKALYGVQRTGRFNGR